MAGKEQVTYTYVIGYDSKVVAERVYSNATDYTDNKISSVTIKDIAVRKEGYIFTGWQQTKDGSIFADIYTNGDVIGLPDTVGQYLAHTDKWYTLVDTTAVNSVMRSNYTDEQITPGTTVHVDMYVMNNSG